MMASGGRRTEPVASSVEFLFARDGLQRAAAEVVASHDGSRRRWRRRRHFTAAVGGGAVVVELRLERATLSVCATAAADHADHAEHVGQILTAARRGRQVWAQVSGRVVRVGQHGVMAVMLLIYRKKNKKNML